MRMFEICEVVEGMSMKGPMEIGSSSNIVSMRLIQDNITIKSVIGWQWQHGFHDE
jgi:hypothetical protein